MAQSNETARLFTFQRKPVLDLFDENGRYVPAWRGTGIAGRHRVAYECVTNQSQIFNASAQPF